MIPKRFICTKLIKKITKLLNYQITKLPNYQIVSLVHHIPSPFLIP